MDLRTVRIPASGRTVHYYRAGQGQPLLYLHHVAGLAGFEPALARLAESFDVIAPFAPGWGPSKDDLEAIEEEIFESGSARQNIERLYALKRRLGVVRHAVPTALAARGRPARAAISP